MFVRRLRSACVLLFTVALVLPLGTHAQQASSATAIMRVSAEVLPSCRIAVAPARLLNPVQLQCSNGLAVPPRLQIIATTRGPLHVIHF